MPFSHPLRLTNTETRKKELVEPSEGDTIRFYACGPTVYDYAHIGNFRTFIFEDILKRTVRFLGMKIIHVMNLTDVDDKTIRGAIQKKVTLDAFTRPYKDAFFEDLKTVNIELADHYPQATDFIPQMIEMIEELIKRGVAYQGADGSVYYAISKFPHYGKLSHLKLDTLEAGASNRVEGDEYSKEHIADFVLWKHYEKDRDGEIFWQSPFGPGRPGWHLECSVMAQRLLGDTIDIHAGGVDLIFPHHENEIAQSEACTGKCFARLWVHAEHLLVDQKKMSKSLGNFYTLRDLLKKGYSGKDLRMLFLQAHYRMQLNFTLLALDGAMHSRQRLQDFIFRLEHYKAPNTVSQSSTIKTDLESALNAFSKSLADDLNTSEAISILFDLVRHINSLIDRSELTHDDIQAILALLQQMDSVLGIMDFQKEEVPQEILSLVQERITARLERNWKRSDELRALLHQKGFSVEDAPDGTARIKKL